MDNRTPVIEIKGIKKSFYGVPVLKGIDLKFYEGECVSLIGENGAGKSTLIKILCGVYSKDEGQIFLDGVEQNITNAEDAKKLGISVIYQELSLFPDLKVYENIFINNEIQKNNKNKISPIDIERMKKEAADVLHNRLHVNVDVNARVADIPFSQRQMVEIARAVHADSRIIFMDEPTTALEDKEKKVLFKIIAELKQQKKTIIFISHHLDEIFENCERTIVLRDGYVVLQKDTKDLTEEELVRSMIGRKIDNYYPKVKYPIGDEEILSVEGLTKEGVFNDISFNVHKREVVGIIGLAGCGKYEIVRSIFGILPPDSGTIHMNGKEIKNRTAADAMKNHIAFLPSERKTESIFPNLDIRWNTTIADLDAINTKRGLSLKTEKEITTKYIDELKIKTSSQTQPISSLSGGNQQKVILARWFMKHPQLLILEEPTRGIDVNAKTEVYRLIMDYVGQDNGVIVVSSEEEEVYGICDKIIVIHNGTISGILNHDDITLEYLKTITKFSKTAEEV